MTVGAGVAAWEAVAGLVDLARRNGVLHLLVDNAGIDGESNPAGTYSLEGWRKVRIPRDLGSHSTGWAM